MMASENTNDQVAFDYIDTSEGLDRLTETLKHANPIALDTEADSFHHYQPKVFLIQLTFDGQNYVIDPLSEMDLSSFLDALSHKKLIIHDAGYDLRLLYNDFGFKPKNEVFDTMLAASLAGLKTVGLSALLNRYFDKTAAKHNQKADWSKRPLPQTNLQYAAEDTAYLIPIRDDLEKELKKLGRLNWYTETCQWAMRAVYTAKEQPDPDHLWRIKGVGKCSPREMAYLKVLWHWREDIAKKTNIAPFMICRNEQMLKLATWAAHRKKEIQASTTLPVRCHNRYQKSLYEALLRAQSLPEEQWPGKIKSDRSKRLSKKTLKLINELKAECETIAKELGLAPQLIASRSALTRIVINQAATVKQIQENQILMNWQTKLMLPAIGRVLNKKETQEA